MAPISNAQPNSHRSALATQHTLQNDDLMKICHLANVEGLEASLEDWRFEQFFGFTLHLFITTESAEIRTQVAQILPKFGSEVILPLVKIAHHFQDKNLHDASIPEHYGVSTLAQQSAGNLTPQALCFGLQAVLTNPESAVLLPMVAKILTQLPTQRKNAVLSGLSLLLAEQEYKRLETQLVMECSRTQLQKSFEISSTAEQHIITEDPTKRPHPEVHLVA